MKRISLLVFGALCSLGDVGQAAQPEARVSDKIDWPQFMARHDLVWSALPKEWTAGAFLGNGLMGAMIYAPEKSGQLSWEVNRSGLFDENTRVPVGFMVLGAPGVKQSGDLRLDLWNAEVRGNLKVGESTMKLRSWIDANSQILYVALTEIQGEVPELTFQHATPNPPALDFEEKPVPEWRKNPTPEFGETSDIKWCRQPFLIGGGYALAVGKKASSSKSVTYAVSLDYFPKGEDVRTNKVVSEVKRALPREEAAFQEHSAWWHKYLQRSFLSVPDKRAEDFYWIQLYKFGAAARSDGPAIDLMGPWFHRTPWSMYWWNLNVQMTYYFLYTANRLDVSETLVNYIDRNKDDLTINVPEEWQADSSYLGRVTGLNMRSESADEHGNLLWALQNYWLQYRYTWDESMIEKRLFPLLKRAVAYYQHILKPGDDGKLHVPKSISPEYEGFVEDANYEISLLRWGLMTLLACNEKFNLRDSDTVKWQKTLDNLVPFPVDDSSGYLIAKGTQLEKAHRHFSHLMMIYPLHLVDPHSKVDRPVIERSVKYWGNLEGGDWNGFSITGQALMEAWLGDGNETGRLLDGFFDRFLKGNTSNTFYVEAHMGPVFETPAMGAAVINEMMLQSWSMDPFGTAIRIFPAVPDDWKDAEFQSLRAEGNFEVSAIRRGGKTVLVQIKSLSGNSCRFYADIDAPEILSGSGKSVLKKEADKNDALVWTIDMKKGDSVTVVAGALAKSGEVINFKPVKAEVNESFFFGEPMP